MKLHETLNPLKGAFLILNQSPLQGVGGIANS
ncbi:hypothetical protein SAMN05216167_10477 [Spirosoma endophyticum]|uniref:Uncharacterized protein n=1 Tax=Spirosoma endophyticum TaxID=662367 RepID=A0A1I1QR76_9BACT|nr:hypothetical protein SAMN05216167_10477 [Spirosoma endophyticum]